VVLLFWVLAWMTERAGRSAMVAGLFAVHPINVESVAWVAERKNLLSMLFFLLALCAYVWYARRPTGARFAAVVVLFALGLMAKPQIIMLPFILLLCDYWPLGRLAVHCRVPQAWRFSRPGYLQGSRHPGLEHRETWGNQVKSEKRFLWLVLEKLPLFALAAASAFLTLAAHSRGAMRPLPLSYRVANALVCYLQYVKLAFWPSRLAVYYPHPLLPLRSWNVLAAFLFLILVTGTVIAERRRRYLPVGWFWFLITLVPMIGVVQVGLQGMADRYAYLPLIGIFLMTTWVLADWASGRRIPLAIQSAVAIVVLAALVVVTHQQLRYWRDSVTLWTHALEVTHHSTIAEVNLGGALLERGDTEQALEHFRAGTAIDPRDPLCNMYLARYAQMQNNLPEAIEGYRRVIAATQDPGLKARAYSNMGYAYRGLGDETEARKCFLAAGEPGQ